MKTEQARRDWEDVKPTEEEEGGMPPSSSSRQASGLRPVPEPEVRARRRQFSPAYKLKILEAADACRGPGALVALLRREGLYFSHLSKWRKLRRLDSLEKMRGRKPDPDAELRQRIRELERENEHLQGKLRQASKIIEVQKKVSEILGVSLEETGSRDETD